MEKKKKTMLWLWISILLCAGAALGCVFTYRDQQVQYVPEACYQDGYVYGVDLKEDRYSIFKYNSETGKSKVIYFPRIKAGRISRIQNIAVDSEGRLFAYREVVDELNNLKREVVYCDFDQGRLESVFDFGYIPGEYWTLMQVEDHVEIFLIEENTEDADWLVCYSLDEESWMFTYCEKVLLPKYTSSILADQEGGFLYGDQFGSFYALGEYGTEKVIFQNDGTQVGKQNVYHDYYNGELHFKNLDAGLNYVVSVYEEDTSPRVCKKCDSITEYQSTKGKLMQPIQAAEGIGLGFLMYEDYRYTPIIYGEKELVIDRFIWPLSQCLRVGMVVFLFGMLICWLLALSYYFIKRWNHGFIPITVKLIITIIPLVFAGYLVIQYEVRQSLRTKMIQENRSMLYQLGMDRIANLDMDWFQEISQKEVTEELKAELYAFHHSWDDKMLEVYFGLDGEIQGSGVKSDVELFFAYRDGACYNLTDIYTYNMPIQYECSYMAGVILEDVRQQGVAISAYYDNGSGRWLSVFIPIIDEQGNVLGALESSKEVFGIDMNVEGQVGKINKYIFYIFIAILTVLLIIVWVSLHPLASLHKAVVALMNRQERVELKSRGNNEISRVLQVFNQMSGHLSNHMKVLQDFHEKYEKFVPSRFFELLDKEDVRSVMLGDNAEMEASIISINSNDFDQIAPYVNSREIFGFMNQTYCILVPFIQEYGGMVDQFQEAGVVAFFTGAAEEPLKASISILQKLHREALSFGGKTIRFSIGISRGTMKLGVIGESARMSVMTVSEYNNLSAFLQKKASEYGATVLITGEAAKAIPDFFEAYHTRMLGYFYIHVTESLEKIYEVYDGDEEDQKRLKMQTSDLFESGVTAFLAGDFQTARGFFVDILRNNRKDLAAGRYFYLCEQYGNEDEEAKRYIEAY